ncbi:MAG: hypothetical protein ACT4QD_15975 [Acidobacteriota bacterium]
MPSPSARHDVSIRRDGILGVEALVSAMVAVLALVIVGSYLAGRLEVGLAPATSVILAVLTAIALHGTLVRGMRWPCLDTAITLLILLGAWGGFAALASPSWLPPGGGPDLTHHLLLIDYIERTGHLVLDASAGAWLGEMAHYTPGLHLLAVIAGALVAGDGFHALHAVVVMTVGLKLALFFLIVRRLLPDSPHRPAFAFCGVLFILQSPAFSLGAFLKDSFLAQVVSELFAVGLWWATTLWAEHQRRGHAALFGVFGAAAFLTWPVWIGPAVLVFVAAAWTIRPFNAPRLGVDTGLALGPVAIVALVHAVGRSDWTSIVATSGAVAPPSIGAVGVLLPLLGTAGFFLALKARYLRVLVAFLVAIALQSAGLWVVATVAGATTPYMAFKMWYLATYPVAACAAIGLEASARLVSRYWPPTAPSSTVRVLGWSAVVLLAAVAAWRLAVDPRPSPIVSEDLWQAGRWAKDHVPASCVDYLVGDEYTAYWLHLALLNNPRASGRTRDDATFLPERAMARWISRQGPKYAIARLSILPAEIRRDVEILARFGTAAVIAARDPVPCP